MVIEPGGTFFIKRPLKSPKYQHLYGKKLTAYVVFGSGDIWPDEEFVSIPSRLVRKTKPLRAFLFKETT